MDADSVDDSEFRPPLPPETPPARPPQPDDTPPDSPMPPIRNISRQGSEARSCESPSLEELEAQYQLIQQSLAKADDDDDDVVTIDSCDESSMSESIEGNASANPIVLTDDSLIEEPDKSDLTIGKLKRNVSTTSIQTFGELGLGSPVNSQPGTPLPNPGTRESSPFTSVNSNAVFKGSLSISKDYGTPILKKSISVEQLPSDVAFKQGIEDHIPFENLPDSTGTYNKMRQLFDKIRQKLPARKKKSW